MEVKVEFWNVQKPTTFGPEYLTFVMWAISPEGRPVNLGEVLIGGNDRGGYIPTGYKCDPVVLNSKLPLEFFEARNALCIAQSAGAESH
jgi:hypothetical protein